MIQNKSSDRPGRLFLLWLVAAMVASSWAAGHTGQAAEKAVISSDKRGWGDTNKGVIHFEGNVVIVFGDMKITCQAAEIDAEGKTGKLSGAVVLIDKGVTIKSDTLDMDLQKRQGVFRGKVILVRDEEKTNQGGKEAVSKERVEVACDQLDANTSKRTFTAAGSVRLGHTDFTATCDTARFDEKSETMVMTGQVRLVRKENEQLAAGQVEVNLKAKSFTATQAVELSFEVEEEKGKAEDDAPEAGSGENRVGEENKPQEP